MIQKTDEKADEKKDQAGPPRRSLGRLEWGVPVGTLVLLFGAFVGVGAAASFGGDTYVQRTAGLTYAEYARQGFWQLLAVTVLTLLVLAIAARVARRETATDRLWIRVLLGLLALLTLVIVASALNRMWLYEQTYGYTVLRLLVSICEGWLGLVFVMVLVAGISSPLADSSPCPIAACASPRYNSPPGT